MLATLALAAATAVNASTAANDICLAMVPPKLEAALTQAHPDYVLPRLTDAPVARLMEIANSGNWPCPFVVVGDFDGDGRLDRAVLLRHKSDPTVRLVAARNLPTGWQLDIQDDWPFGIENAAIDPLEPGLYEQPHGSAAADLDNIKTIQSDHPGFVAGELAKARRSYFFVDTQWQSILVTDTP